MNDPISTCLIFIPALTLAAALLVAIFGARVLKQHSHWPVVLALLGSFFFSIVLWREVLAGQKANPAGGFEQIVPLWTWAEVPDAYDLKANPPAVSAAEAGPRPFRIEITLRADALTAMMLAMVTFVSTLVTVFASGYMHGDRGYWRFFAYIGLFVFSMTMLVSVSNFVLLFVFWEAVGVCSYLLIGFWYQKPEAVAAGKKAFLVNRVGDFAFTIALFLIWTTYGTLNYHDTWADGSQIRGDLPALTAIEDQPSADGRFIRGVLGKSRIEAGDYAAGGIATAICLLLLLGACGKSAQFPLHIWLPDAMEGPTPVSALIHAATMVTAGVYMVARCTPLFAVSPTAQLVVACIGGFTALLAALIALTQFDLKRVLAYSTISQLGYMFLALGVGTMAGVTGGMYHLFTHAFFKALLFLGAGSVMHAMGGVIDMRQFGGLRRLMPHTYWTFLFGCLALAGVLPFAGFWSKDTVIAAVHDRATAIHDEIHHRSAPAHGTQEPKVRGQVSAENPLSNWTDAQLAASSSAYEWLYWISLFTAFLTAFYTFRAFFLAFHGPERIPAAAGHHAHESPPVMLMPLVVLAVCAVVIGMAMVPDWSNWGTNRLLTFLGGTPSLAAGTIATTRVEHPHFHLTVAGLSTLAALAGIVLALYLYTGEQCEVRALQRWFDLQGIDRATDPQWVVQLAQVGWIASLTRALKQVHLGWIVTLAGYLLGLISLVLALPLMIGSFVSPYRLSANKFYFDEIYSALFVWPLRLVAAVFYWLDRWVIDGLVNLLGRIPPAIGSLMRSLQMGQVQFYALAMVLGMLLLAAARLLWAG
jgi:NADH-quinone oxidoreductase subunit L